MRVQIGKFTISPKWACLKTTWAVPTILRSNKTQFPGFHTVAIFFLLTVLRFSLPPSSYSLSSFLSCSFDLHWYLEDSNISHPILTSSLGALASLIPTIRNIKYQRKKGQWIWTSLCGVSGTKDVNINSYTRQCVNM